jgi:uncharacterized protein (DUF342 family)
LARFSLYPTPAVTPQGHQFIGEFRKENFVNSLHRHHRSRQLERGSLEAFSPVDLFAEDATGLIYCRAEWGSMEIWVAADAMEVVLLSLERGRRYYDLDSGQVIASLAARGIVVGILHQAIEIVVAASVRGRWHGHQVIARGSIGESSIDWLCPGGDLIDAAALGHGSLDYTDLERMLAAPVLPDLNRNEMTATAVRPGTPLARRRDPEEITPRQDVFGRALPVLLSPLTAGRYVTYCSRSQHFTAEVLGYVILVDGVISLVPPLWVSPNGMEVFYIGLAQRGLSFKPQPQDLYSVLQTRGIAFGIDDCAVKDICQRCSESNDRSWVRSLARGLPPQEGTDARLVLNFEAALRPGLVMSDGSIDFRERGLVNNVRCGDLLALKYPAKAGEPGCSVYGETVVPDEDCDIAAGAGVGVESVGDSPIRFYANIDGALHWDKSFLSVRRAYIVDGDVDYATGNIRVEEDLYIAGSVRSGFTVEAGGNIVITGSIESGAVIKSKGDLSVVKGVTGASTRLIVKGDLWTDYIHQATVLVGGDVRIGRYILHASVRCGGMLKVEKGGGPRAGSVIGGQISAGKGIRLFIAGSVSTPRTLLSLEADPVARARIVQLTRAIKSHEASIAKILRTLNLDKVDLRRVQEVLDEASPTRQAFYKRLLGQLKRLIRERCKYQNRIRRLETAIVDRLSRAEIRISRRAYARTTIRIGHHNMGIDDDQSGLTAYLSAKGVRLR